jgi:hypothetical protein
MNVLVFFVRNFEGWIDRVFYRGLFHCMKFNRGLMKGTGFAYYWGGRKPRFMTTQSTVIWKGCYLVIVSALWRTQGLMFKPLLPPCALYSQEARVFEQLTTRGGEKFHSPFCCLVQASTTLIRR